MKLHEMIREYNSECFSIERYIAAETVCIHKTRDEWGVLDNCKNYTQNIKKILLYFVALLFRLTIFAIYIIIHY